MTVRRLQDAQTPYSDDIQVTNCLWTSHVDELLRYLHNVAVTLLAFMHFVFISGHLRFLFIYFIDIYLQQCSINYYLMVSLLDGIHLQSFSLNVRNCLVENVLLVLPRQCKQTSRWHLHRISVVYTNFDHRKL